MLNMSARLSTGMKPHRAAQPTFPMPYEWDVAEDLLLS